MCGIFVYVEKEHSNIEFEKIFDLLNHRGPDSRGFKTIHLSNQDIKLHMLHTRLKINGDDTPQPLVSDDGNVFLIVNGEIFNYKELEKELGVSVHKSDCEILLHLYERYKNTDISQIFKRLCGQYSFVLYDKSSEMIFVGRDHIGITPLYIGKDTRTGNIAISSEMKCLTTIVDQIEVFYPRRYSYVNVKELLDSHFVSHVYKSYISSEYGQSTHKQNVLKTLLKDSVQKRLKDVIVNGVEFGVLLSGGLDSSIIASLVVKLAKEMGYNKKVKTFTIGVSKDVPDVVGARKVATYLETDHHEYYFTLSEGFESIKDVIWHIESYDCTTVRASTPMYLLAKKIKEQYSNLKVLYSGELSDELMCYLYGANSPSLDEFQRETMNLVSNVHYFDCLRANKTCMAHSIEVRVPFTDKSYVEYILKLHPQYKVFGNYAKPGVMEKQILRDAFKGCLPKEILYRKKEQFSDGVSGYDIESNWIDYIKKRCNSMYDEYVYQLRILDYSFNRPQTKEELYYRQMFCKLFNKNSYSNTSELTVRKWIPKWSNNKDPSGRVQIFWNRN